MKFLNNKGLTLIELIVSIALISVIMIFMYRLMANITFEKDNDYIATGNTMQRNEIISTIEKTLNKDDLYGVENENNIIKFLDYDGEPKYTLIIDTSDTLIFQEYNETINKWTIKEAKFANKINCTALSFNYESIYNCTINVYTSNKNNRLLGSDSSINNNNSLDDISFSVNIT